VCPPFQGLEGDVELAVVKSPIKRRDHIFDLLRVVGEGKASAGQLIKKRRLTDGKNLGLRRFLGELAGKHP
jgi:hypothetical protein